MYRRYNRWHARFDQPDPYEGSYDLTDPQSFNRYSYTRGDPVNFIDPTGLDIGFVGPPERRSPPVSLFDDYFINAWKSGWSMLYGLNPMRMTFPTSYGSFEGGYWTEFTTITLQTPPNAKRVEKEMWERRWRVMEENRRNREKAEKAYEDCVRPFRAALDKELAGIEETYEMKIRFAVGVMTIGGMVIGGPLAGGVAGLTTGLVYEHDMAVDKEQAEIRSGRARDEACGKGPHDPRYGYSPKELPPAPGP